MRQGQDELCDLLPFTTTIVPLACVGVLVYEKAIMCVRTAAFGLCLYLKEPWTKGGDERGISLFQKLLFLLPFWPSSSPALHVVLLKQQDVLKMHEGSGRVFTESSYKVQLGDCVRPESGSQV